MTIYIYIPALGERLSMLCLSSSLCLLMLYIYYRFTQTTTLKKINVENKDEKKDGVVKALVDAGVSTIRKELWSCRIGK